MLNFGLVERTTMFQKVKYYKNYQACKLLKAGKARYFANKFYPN